MAISSDMLIERSRMKRQISFWRLAAIGAIVFFLVLMIETPDVASVGTSYIARVDIEGVITDDLAEQKLLDDLGNNDNVKAVILYMNTPGGTAVGGEELFKRIIKLKEKKPVIALMRSLCTSAGVMSAVAADRIYASNGTITGSIGVILQTADVTELASKVGVLPVIVKSGPLKGSPSPFEKLDPAGRAVVQSLIDDFHKVFVQLVADARHLPYATVAALADGRVLSAHQALDAKLIDAIGGEDEARQWLMENKKLDLSLKVIKMEPKKERQTLIERLSSMAGFRLPSAITSLRLDGLLLIWQPAFN
ncbi:MAG: signal peptide peptidase SppA [Rickettsiales bacterium]|nr:signal peptide peptidase SppA [Rickettsiales bacterium]